MLWVIWCGKSWIRTHTERTSPVFLLSSPFVKPLWSFVQETISRQILSKCKSHHAMRHAAVAPETPDRYRNWRPQCCTRPWTLFIVFINMKTLGTVSYAAFLRSVIPSVHERLFLSIFKRTFESWKKSRESRSSRRHQWKRARRFHERWLFEGRMSSLLFTDDGCYSSFIRRLTSGRY